MAATFIERCIQLGDFYEDGGAIDLNQLYAAVCLYDAGIENAAFLKGIFNCTAAQGDELDEILATRPGVLEQVLTRAQWVHKFVGTMYAGFCQWTGYTTANACRAKLGL